MGIYYALKDRASVLAVCFMLIIAACNKETIDNNAEHFIKANIEDCYYKGKTGGHFFNVGGEHNAFVGEIVLEDGPEHRSTEEGEEGEEGAKQERVFYSTGGVWSPGNSENANANANTDGVGSAHGLANQNGTIEVRMLAVRIYVAPINPGTLHNIYYGMMQPGPRAFATTESPYDGAYVEWRDENGVLWTSLGEQPFTSRFQISARGENEGIETPMQGTFTARLYDENGNTLDMTDASFIVMAGLE